MRGTFSLETREEKYFFNPTSRSQSANVCNLSWPDIISPIRVACRLDVWQYAALIPVLDSFRSDASNANISQNLKYLPSDDLKDENLAQMVQLYRTMKRYLRPCVWTNKRLGAVFRVVPQINLAHSCVTPLWTSYQNIRAQHQANLCLYETLLQGQYLPQ